MNENEFKNQKVIISINAGGGEESCEFVEELSKMIAKYCNSSGFLLKVTDYQDGLVKGIKSISYICDGNNAYDYLRVLKGVHRKIDWMKSNKSQKRSTLAAIDVIPMITNTNVSLDINDLKVETFHSSGAGGQHINKTDSAVRITHLKTGIVVSCQQERSQIKNKEIAINILKSQLQKLNDDNRQTLVAKYQGDVKQIVLGSQIITYMFCPKMLVKDSRSGYQSTEVEKVLAGKLQPLIDCYLNKQETKK